LRYPKLQLPKKEAPATPAVKKEAPAPKKVAAPAKVEG